VAVNGLSPDLGPSEKDWPHHAILIDRCSMTALKFAQPP
jgi:hypothetical protein